MLRITVKSRDVSLIWLNIMYIKWRHDVKSDVISSSFVVNGIIMTKCQFTAITFT